MAKPIGIGESQEAWEGPVTLPFEHIRTHGRTARYQALRHPDFTLYVPLFMRAVQALPQQILVSIKRSDGIPRSLGSEHETSGTLATSEVCEFEIDQQMAHSVKYTMKDDGQKYSVYVPYDVFEGAAAPAMLRLEIELPRDAADSGH